MLLFTISIDSYVLGERKPHLKLYLKTLMQFMQGSAT